MSTIISKLTFVAAALFTCALVSGCTTNGLDETEYLVDPSADDDAVTDCARDADGAKDADCGEGSTGPNDAASKDAASVKNAGNEEPDGYHEE